MARTSCKSMKGEVGQFWYCRGAHVAHNNDYIGSCTPAEGGSGCCKLCGCDHVHEVEAGSGSSKACSNNDCKTTFIRHRLS
jgi:hypothetical protein